MTKDFKTLCEERFSARKFTAEKVSEEDINYIMDCVRLAPSAVNRQPWKFVVCRSADALCRLSACYDREWFRTAPLAFIACKQKEEQWVRSYDGKPHGDVDLGIAVEHLCLAAADRRLGSCWICNYDPVKLRELFPMGDEWEAVAIIPVGHIAPDCPRKEKTRKPAEEIFVREE